MGAFADLSELVASGTGGTSGGVAGAPQHVPSSKVGRVAGAAATAPIVGRAASLWTYDGQPGAGVAPGAVAVPTRATAGAIGQANPVSGETWLQGISVWNNLTTGTLQLYDRLLHIGGLSATTTTPQTVGGALTRHTNGLGNFIMVEIYGIVGTTATTITATYTNENGTGSRVTTAEAFGGTNNREVTRAIILPLAAGDEGVQAVADVGLVVSTGTAGNFGVTVGHYIGHPLILPVAGIGAARDFISGQPPMQEIESDACLAWIWTAGTTTAPEFNAMLSIVER